ncbi:hypothetical protein [Piscinibacter gummiphilus]|uniref:Uncharacterized protein n=1 Tax=Piscinibacter gummiphilus TaxID=946333 RepID=A0ABZ0D0S6_9BURK|nr:hypothetical protein [Piscinibacter gummiphilus]WOB10840.1 hypothetical protein RXV79_12485 [Piscinibacter gummiphilus]
MRPTLHLLLGAGLAATLAGGCATTEPTPAAPGAMGPASMSHDCMAMPMHASGDDKPMPMMKPMQCAAKAADPASAASRDDHKH